MSNQGQPQRTQPNPVAQPGQPVYRMPQPVNMPMPYAPNMQPVPQGYYYAPPGPAMPQALTPEQLKQRKNMEIDRIMPKSGSSMFGGIVIRPRKARFGTQNPGELVYVLVRQHWIVNVGWILRNTFYAFVPAIFWLLIPTIVKILGITNNPVPDKVWILVLISYYSVLFTLVIKNFVEWFFDILIITNERIIDYEFSPFTGYDVTEADLANIEDIKEGLRDFWGGIFNYGNIEATTASSRGKLDFTKVPNVTKVRDILSDLASIARKYSRNGD